MTVSSIHELLRSGGFTSGVYNYCDRWCERCSQHDRCLVAAYTRQVGDGNDPDLALSLVHSSLEMASELLVDSSDDAAVASAERSSSESRKSSNGRPPAAANDCDEVGPAQGKLCFLDDDLGKEEAGFDGAVTGLAGNSISEEHDETESEKFREARLLELTSALAGIRSHSLLKRAEGYAQRVNTWLASAGEGGLEALGPQAAQRRNFVTIDQIEDFGESFAESLETILRYRFLICTKLFRALFGIQSVDHEDDPCLIADADGSAKVALLAIDRSTEAWLQIRDSVETDPDWVVETLFILDCLRIEAETLFPRARDFQRPGFDQAN